MGSASWIEEGLAGLATAMGMVKAWHSLWDLDGTFLGFGISLLCFF